MELFLDNRFKNRNKIIFGFILVVFDASILRYTSCSVWQKYKKSCITKTQQTASKIAHTFFLVGDAGNANEEKAQQTLGLLANQLKKAD